MKKPYARLLIALIAVIGLAAAGIAVVVKSAADQGNGTAVAMVATAYAKLRGIDAASAYLDKTIRDRPQSGAAIAAKLTYAHLYSEGTGGAQSDEKALDWLYQAATDYEFPMAPMPARQLEEMFPQASREEALHSRLVTSLKKRAEEGDAKALYILAFAHGAVSENRATAMAYLEQAAEKGLGRAQYAFSYTFLISEDGTLTEKQKQSYTKWMCLAAKSEIAAAEFECARAWHQGFGVSKDPVRAYVWNTRSLGNKTWQVIADYSARKDSEQLQSTLEKEMSPAQIKAAKDLAAKQTPAP